MRKIGWGVIGSGGIARRRTIPEGIAAASNGELRAVYDIDAAVNRAVAEQHGARACSSLDELLGEELDAVYVATPVDLHREQTLAAFEAGKHVLCEKPLGLTVGQAQEMAAAAARAGRLLGAAYMMRFQAQHQAALKLIREGRLGVPVFARAQLSCWYPPIAGAWRQEAGRGGGGSLVDMGAHALDLLEMFFGPVAEVTCVTRNRVQAYEPEDTAVALVAFANGAVGVIDACFSIPDAANDNVLELYGSRGAILARGTIGQGERGRMTARLEAPGGYQAQQERAAGGEVEIDPAPVNMYRAEIEDFGRAVLESGQPAVGAALAIRNLRVIEACYESARVGCKVAIE